MKLKNKKTGEIRELPHGFFCGDNLKKICKEWEDYVEPKRTWFIDTNCAPNYIDYGDNPITDHCYDGWNELGICFETKEEAEQAIEKLKAFKRLEEKGFRFIGKTYETDKRFGSVFYKVDEDTYSEDIVDDLDLLFSGGEE